MKQTEELFKNGRVTSDGGRGTAYVEGTAFSRGSGGIGKVVIAAIMDSGSSKTKTTTKKNEEETTSGKGSTGTEGGTNKNQNSYSVGDDKKEFEETFDWIEVEIERLERDIDTLDKVVDSAYESWSDRNLALSNEIIAVGDTIDYLESAADKYLDKAKSVGNGLSRDYIEQIQKGTLKIEDFVGVEDEATLEQIKEYQKWYKLYKECIDKIFELKETEAELYSKDAFDLIEGEFEGILQGFEHTEKMLNEYISQAEAKGHIVSSEYYQSLINNEQLVINTLNSERDAYLRAREEYVKAKQEEGRTLEEIYESEAYQDMSADIDGTTQEIEEATTKTIEWKNAIRDLDFEVFELIHERISNVVSEAEFLIDLMSNDKLFDDNGKLTDKGMATMGLHGQNYSTYMYEANDYGAKVKEIDNKIASGELDGLSQDVINKRQEYIELQRESILNAEQEKQAIKNLVEEGINIELEALQEKINLYQESLDSQKD